MGDKAGCIINPLTNRAIKTSTKLGKRLVAEAESIEKEIKAAKVIKAAAKRAAVKKPEKKIISVYNRMDAPKRGRPKKPATEGTAAQVKKREYQRKYQNEVKQGITELEKAEADCLKELEKIRKQRKELIDQLDKASKQASGILKEAVGKK
jgi:hypothetical protein